MDEAELYHFTQKLVKSERGLITVGATWTVRIGAFVILSNLPTNVP